MSEQNKMGGKREAPQEEGTLRRWWSEHCQWVEEMSSGQRLRYRLLQVATVLAVLIIVGYFALASWMKMPEVEGKVPTGPETQEQETPQTGIKNGRKVGVYTFLVAGKDVASGATDTMLLLTYDTNAKTIYGMNLPRDTMVNVSTSAKRLNTVYAFNRTGEKEERTANGMEALKAEVANLTGITPDFYVLVEWDAIGRLVDALGGVEFEVPFDMDYDDPYQDLHIHQKAGLRTLTGDDAMQVIRHRKNNDGSHSNGDIGRMEVQQDFLKAVVKKCLQPATFLKINDLVRIFKENVETDLTVGNILAFAEKAVGMDPENGIEFFTAPVAEYFIYKKASMLTLDSEAMLDVVNEKMNPYAEDVTLEDLEILIYHSNSSFTVTNGELKDSSLGIPYTPPVSEPEPEAEQPTGEAETPESQPGEGEITGEGTTLESEQPAQGGETQPGEEQTPEQGETVTPGGEASAETPEPQPGEGEATGEETPAVPEQPSSEVQTQPESGEEPTGVAVLPSQPAPVENVA